ncbi:hypothetical protein D3C85_1693600 [compost metagenome]
MGLRAEVINLVRLHFLDDTGQVGGVGQVAVMKNELLVINVRILIYMVDALSVERRSTTLDAVDFVALLQQELCEVGTVLTGDASY